MSLVNYWDSAWCVSDMQVTSQLLGLCVVRGCQSQICKSLVSYWDSAWCVHAVSDKHVTIITGTLLYIAQARDVCVMHVNHS